MISSHESFGKNLWSEVTRQGCIAGTRTLVIMVVLEVSLLRFRSRLAQSQLLYPLRGRRLSYDRLLVLSKGRARHWAHTISTLDASFCPGFTSQHEDPHATYRSVAKGLMITYHADLPWVPDDLRCTLLPFLDELDVDLTQSRLSGPRHGNSHRRVTHA